MGLLGSMILGSSWAQASPGQVDLFNSGQGWRARNILPNDGVYKVLLRPDGNYFAIGGTIGGSYLRASPADDFAPLPGCNPPDFSAYGFYNGLALPDNGALLLGSKAGIGVIVRVNADCTLRTSFGTNGEVLVPPTRLRYSFTHNAVHMPERGQVLVLLQEANAAFDDFRADLLSIDTDSGLPTALVGSGGRKALLRFTYFSPAQYVSYWGDDVVVCGSTTIDGKRNGIVLRYSLAGSFYPEFSDDGALISAFSTDADTIACGITPDGNSIWAVGAATQPVQPYFLKVNRITGALVPGFPLMLPEAGFNVTNGAYDAKVDAIYAAGNSLVDGVRTARIGRVLGVAWDVEFAYNSNAANARSNSVRVSSVAIRPDGKIVVGGSVGPTGAAMSAVGRLVGVEKTGNAIEFYNSNLNHYFITAEAAEAAAIDSGSAGPGWSRTMESFKSGGPDRVCRFYGTPGVGPNSHFYTIVTPECTQVKLDPGWHFESYDFSGWPTNANGSCPEGTQAVKRVYNNRAAFNDSNHRYTTSDALYNQMLTLGWSGEGIVFCAPV